MTDDALDRATTVPRERFCEPGDVGALPAGRELAVARLREALEERAARRRVGRRLALAAAVAAPKRE